MKKFSAVILVFMLIAINVAVADVFDWSSLSDDDLLLAYDEIAAEIAARGIGKGEILYEGQYVVGEDIEPGEYEVEAESANEYVSFVSVSVSELTGLVDIKNLNVGETAHIRIKEGQAVYVNFGNVYIRPQGSATSGK